MSDGTEHVTSRQLTVHDVWALPQGSKVVVQFNDNHQAIGDSGGLLGVFLGTIGDNFRLFPISYRDWRSIPQQLKTNVFVNNVQV